MRQKLTASVIAKLQVPEGQKLMRTYDTEVGGLCVRVMASGLASFVFIRRPKGSNKPREVTIGRCGEMSVEKARQIARNLSTEFAAPDYLSSKAKIDSIPSFSDAVSQYDELSLSKKSSGYREKTLGTLRRYALKKLGSLRVSEIQRQHVATLIIPLIRDGKDATAQMVWEAVSNVLTWSVKFGHRDDNPLIRLKPDFKKVARERVLSTQEVAEVWKAADSLSEVHRAAVRLLLLLPFRKSEFLSCRWNEFDDKWLSIPPERTKNSDATSLFLSPLAVSQLPPRRNDCELIFTTDGMVPTLLGSKVQKKLRDITGIPHWQFHDFRRTFSTHMHEAVIDGLVDHHFVIEACMNHRDGSRRGVAGVYNRAKYTAQKQTVLQAWSDIVEQVVGNR